LNKEAPQDLDFQSLNNFLSAVLHSV